MPCDHSLFFRPVRKLGLGRPHDGPDELANLLCLCPNHHVLFDNGGFAIADDLSLIDIEGRLASSLDHPIDRQHLAYHRGLAGQDALTQRD